MEEGVLVRSEMLSLESVVTVPQGIGSTRVDVQLRPRSTGIGT